MRDLPCRQVPPSEPECLGLNDKKLCVDTGGQWDPLACGDAKCGIPNPCEAIIPGCNCGPTESFQSGVGCVEDPSEGVSVECMTDDDCEECGVCGGGTCYYPGLAECASDDDCPPEASAGVVPSARKSRKAKRKSKSAREPGGPGIRRPAAIGSVETTPVRGHHSRL